MSDYNENILTNSAGNEIKKHYSMSIPENIEVFPTLYWRPIMRESPVSTKFLTASKKCVMKLLSKTIAEVFKLLYKSVENKKIIKSYHSKSKFYPGVNSFWVTQNNNPVIDTLNNFC